MKPDLPPKLSLILVSLPNLIFRTPRQNWRFHLRHLLDILTSLPKFTCDLGAQVGFETY